MAVLDHPLTVDDLYTMPDDGMRHELQAGALVSEPLPGFLHGRVAATIVRLLATHIKGQHLGAALTCDTGFVLARGPDTLRGPDIAFVTQERLPSKDDEIRAFEGAPDLAVEILSPSNTADAIHSKVADYLAAGTQLVWVVDPRPERETVTAFRSLLSPRTLSRDDALDGEDVVPGFNVSVAELFDI